MDTDREASQSPKRRAPTATEVVEDEDEPMQDNEGLTHITKPHLRQLNKRVKLMLRLILTSRHTVFANRYLLAK